MYPMGGAGFRRIVMEVILAKVYINYVQCFKIGKL